MLGEVNGIFGVQGWIKVFSDTSPRENIISFKSWYLSEGGRGREGGGKAQTASDTSGKWTQYKLEGGRRQGKNVVAKLVGIAGRDDAAALVGRRIAVDREQLPDLAADEFYWSDLIGFNVIDAGGHRLGRVDRMFETGANDVMVVARDSESTDSDTQAESEILIPWVRGSVIVDIDMAANLISVDWDPDF